MALNIGKFLEGKKVALILVEVQRGVIGDLAGSPNPLAEAATQVNLIANCARLAEVVRERGGTVIHALANTKAGRFGANRNARLFAGRAKDMPPYNPDADTPCQGVFKEGDVVFARQNGLSPMSDTPLDSMLRHEGVTTIIIAGVSLNIALVNLAFDGVNKGYQVMVASDAVAGTPVEYAGPIMQNTLGIITTIASTDDIAAAWPVAAAA